MEGKNQGPTDQGCDRAEAELKQSLLPASCLSELLPGSKGILDYQGLLNQ
jgi:hypothetical protein